MNEAQALKQKNDFLMKEVDRLRERIGDLNVSAARYNRLRRLELIVMAEDGAKYLKGADLDEYIDELPKESKLFTRAELLKELTPALNNIFDDEYAKYQNEHKEFLNEQT